MTAHTTVHRDLDEARRAAGRSLPFELTGEVMSAVAAEQWMPLVRLASFLLDDRAVAEEVVQEAFENVWRRRPSVPDSGALTAYLRVSVVNGCRSTGRRRRTAARSLTLIRAGHDELDVPADAALLQDEDRRRLRDAVSGLPARQREVLVLRYWSRLPEAEIAQTLGISAGAVKSTAHRALAALRDNLKGQS